MVDEEYLPEVSAQLISKTLSQRHQLFTYLPSFHQDW